MLPNDYQRLAARTETDQKRSVARIANLAMSKTADYKDNQLVGIRLNHSALGLAGEAGELAGAVEKNVYYGQELDRDNVVEELGDCLWYIALACNALGVDLDYVMQANIAKLQARYPDAYSDLRAAVRDRQEEARARQRASSGGPIGEEVVLGPSQPCNLGASVFDEWGKRAAANLDKEITRRRTKKEVRAAQSTPAGCCENHADNQGCNCLFEATGPDPMCVHCRGAGEVSCEWSRDKTPCPVCGGDNAEAK